MELKMNTALTLAEREPAQPTLRTAGPGLCVLIVEDDDADAYLIECALAANPNISDVVRAVDGVEALRLVDTGGVRPDVALIDLHMPRKNGFQLLADFAARPEPYFPMVVLTSSTAPTDAMRSRLRGAARVLTKPESTQDLETVLAAAIQSACTGVTLSPAKRAPRRRPAFDNTAPRPRGRKITPIN
jgi:CheY-like chemotaxis protein